MAKIRGFEIEKSVFYPPALLLGLMLFFGLFFTEKFGAAASEILQYTIDRFGWLYLLCTAFFFFFVLFLVITPFGKIRLGGENAKPHLSYLSWCNIAICGGIAVGMVFWGVAEPMTHYYTPPPFVGAEAQSPAAAIRGLQIGVFHWAFVPYSMFTLFGVAIGYATYNRGLPFRASSALYPLLKEHIYGLPGKIVDAISIFALVAGVITSLGIGTMQFASGLEFQFGIAPSNTIYVTIIILLTLIYTISSYSGLQKGIKYLSHINAVIFFGFVIFLFLFGPTRFLLNSAVQVSGSFITNLIPSFLNIDAFGEDKWSGGWTIFFWAWWVVYAPIIGMFLARIAVGRTIREFILVNIFVPGAFVFSWFIAFGGSAIYLDHFNQAGIMGVINEKGLEVAMYALFEHLPLANITIPLGIFALGISFVTLADSMTSTIAIMTTKNTLKAEAPSSVKIFWGVLTGATTIICLLVSGSVGTKALQTASIVAALPIFTIMLATLVSIIMFASKYKTSMDLPEYYPEELKSAESGTEETSEHLAGIKVAAQAAPQVAIRLRS